MGYVWVRPYRTHISYTFNRQPICSPYHGYNHSYLMLTHFLGSSYMSDVFCKNVTYIKLCMGRVMGVVYVFVFWMHKEKHLFRLYFIALRSITWTFVFKLVFITSWGIHDFIPSDFSKSKNLTTNIILISVQINNKLSSLHYIRIISVYNFVYLNW